MPIPIYGTLWIILIAYVIRYLPYGMRYIYSGMLQIHRSWRKRPASPAPARSTTLRRIIAPLLAPALVAGWLFIFLIGATRSCRSPMLLAGPGSQIIAVAMFDLWVNGQGGELAAFGLIWTVLMTLVAAAFYFITRRQSQSIVEA